MSLINQYSFIWIAAVLVTIAAAFLQRKRPNRQKLLFFGLVVTVAIAWLVLHPVQTPQMNTTAQVQDQIGQGTPVLLEFQSPY